MSILVSIFLSIYKGCVENVDFRNENEFKKKVTRIKIYRERIGEERKRHC